MNYSQIDVLIDLSKKYQFIGVSRNDFYSLLHNDFTNNIHMNKYIIHDYLNDGFIRIYLKNGIPQGKFISSEDWSQPISYEKINDYLKLKSFW